MAGHPSSDSSSSLSPPARWNGVTLAERCASEAEARAALSSYAEQGHAWSGLVCYRVLRKRGDAYLCPDGTPYFPKAELGF